MQSEAPEASGETTPRLVAVSGRLQGTVFPLEKQETSIGRDPKNSICINEHWISREHCLLKKEGERFKIIDLGSHNGTFVNGTPVKEHLLQHEDRIGFAGAMFLFLEREVDAAVEATEVRLGEDVSPFGPTVQLRREDAVYLHPEKLSKTQLPPERLERDLGVLLKISILSPPYATDRSSDGKFSSDSSRSCPPSERPYSLARVMKEASSPLLSAWSGKASDRSG